jgi:hypothetical protein
MPSKKKKSKMASAIKLTISLGVPQGTNVTANYSFTLILKNNH